MYANRFPLTPVYNLPCQGSTFLIEMAWVAINMLRKRPTQTRVNGPQKVHIRSSGMQTHKILSNQTIKVIIITVRYRPSQLFRISYLKEAPLGKRIHTAHDLLACFHLSWNHRISSDCSHVPVRDPHLLTSRR